MRGGRTDSSVESHPCLRGMLWSALPQGWSLVHLEDVSDIISGIGFPVHLQGRTDEPIPFFKVGDISEAWKRGSPILRSANHHVNWADLQRLRGQLLPKGTTVFAKIGAAIALNRRGLLATPSLVDNNVMGLAPGKVVNERFLFHFACVITLDSISQATTVPSVRKSDVAEIPVPLPPLPEQQRIVDEVEKQFTRLDAAVAGLQRVKANLKRYRASVLKAACEGRLVSTEAELARREGRPFESGEDLLNRILKERRARWEAEQLAKMKAAGRVPAGDAWKAKYENPPELEGSIAPDMPEGWLAVSGAQLFSWRSGDFLPASQQAEGAFPVYGGNGIAGAHDQTNCAQATLVVGRVGAHCGNVHVSTGPAWITDNAILAAFVPTDANLHFLWLAFKRADLRKQSKGVGQPFVNQSTLNETVLPLPPLPEQHRIVAEVERRLSVVDELEATVEKNLARCARLRQSILKRAFEGRLVPQNPNDEPASVLLERIRAERAAEGSGAKGRMVRK